MLSPLYGQLSPLRVPTKTERVISADADVVSYILAVEAADGQQLEQGVITAVESFILGCKSDGIWSAIKASCILAGARTLSGALVPLVGTAPTNFNFVSADYDRETGLVGNGSTKYLNSNRNNNADPQNNQHLSSYITFVSINDRTLIGTSSATGSSSIIARAGGINRYNVRSQSITLNTTANGTALDGNFIGITRSNSTQFVTQYNGNSVTLNRTSEIPLNQNIHIFAGNAALFYAGRLSFYSIGENIDLSLLDSRVSTLMTDLAAAI